MACQASGTLEPAQFLISTFMTALPFLTLPTCPICISPPIVRSPKVCSPSISIVVDYLLVVLGLDGLTGPISHKFRSVYCSDQHDDATIASACNARASGSCTFFLEPCTYSRWVLAAFARLQRGTVLLGNIGAFAAFEMLGSPYRVCKHGHFHAHSSLPALRHHFLC